MMRKAILLIIPVLVLIAVVVAVIIGQAIYHPPDWETELEKYVRSQNAFITVQLAEKAAKPWNFGKDMRVRYNYDGRPFPFDPEEVWCVLLKQSAPPTGNNTVRRTNKIVFVAFHPEIHRAEWTVYEGESEPFSRLFKEDLSGIGCKLGLDN